MTSEYVNSREWFQYSCFKNLWSRIHLMIYSRRRDLCPSGHYLMTESKLMITSQREGGSYFGLTSSNRFDRLWFDWWTVDSCGCVWIKQRRCQAADLGMQVAAVDRWSRSTCFVSSRSSTPHSFFDWQVNEVCQVSHRKRSRRSGVKDGWSCSSVHNLFFRRRRRRKKRSRESQVHRFLFFQVFFFFFLFFIFFLFVLFLSSSSSLFLLWYIHCIFVYKRGKKWENKRERKGGQRSPFWIRLQKLRPVVPLCLSFFSFFWGKNSYNS